MPYVVRWAAVSLAASVAVCVLAGCTHPTVVVTRANATAPGVGSGAAAKVDGIPFFAKYGVCTQETVWLEPQYTWALTIAADDQPAVTKTVTLSGYAYRQPDVQRALGSLQALNGKHAVSEDDQAYCPLMARQSWSAVSENSAYAVHDLTEGADGVQTALPGTLVRVANTATVSTAVDYSQLYYINARTPFIGTGNIDAKLNADGTLTEGNGQVNDQTWATVLGALSGMSSFAQTMSGIAAPGAVATAASALSSDEPGLAGMAAPPPPMPAKEPHGAVHRAWACPAPWGWPAATTMVTYTFAETEVVYQHDHLQQSRLGPDGACAAAGGMGVTGGSFVVTKLDAGKKAVAPTPAQP